MLLALLELFLRCCSRFCTAQPFKFFSPQVFESTWSSVDLSDSGTSPHRAPLSAMPLMNPTGTEWDFCCSWW